MRRLRGLLSRTLTEQPGSRDFIPIVVDYVIEHRQIVQQPKECYLGKWMDELFTFSFERLKEYFASSIHPLKIKQYKWSPDDVLWLQSESRVVHRIPNMPLGRRQEIQDFLRQYSSRRLRNILCELYHVKAAIPSFASRSASSFPGSPE